MKACKKWHILMFWAVFLIGIGMVNGEVITINSHLDTYVVSGLWDNPAWAYDNDYTTGSISNTDGYMCANLTTNVSNYNVTFNLALNMFNTGLGFILCRNTSSSNEYPDRWLIASSSYIGFYIHMYNYSSPINWSLPNNCINNSNGFISLCVRHDDGHIVYNESTLTYQYIKPTNNITFIDNCSINTISALNFSFRNATNNLLFNKINLTINMSIIYQNGTGYQMNWSGNNTFDDNQHICLDKHSATYANITVNYNTSEKSVTYVLYNYLLDNISEKIDLYVNDSFAVDNCSNYTINLLNFSFKNGTNTYTPNTNDLDTTINMVINYQNESGNQFNFTISTYDANQYICSNNLYGTSYADIEINYSTPSKYFRYFLDDYYLDMLTKNITIFANDSIAIDNCSKYVINALNFSFKNTTGSTDLDVFLKYYISYLNESGSTLTYSVTTYDANQYLCTNNLYSSVSANIQMEYSPLSLTPFYYNINNYLMDRFAENITLYATDSTTAVVLIVYDEYGHTLEDVYIDVYEWDTGMGIYKLITSVVTGNDGQSIVYLVLGTKQYKFVLTYNGVVELTTSKGVLTEATKEFFILIGEEFVDIYEPMSNLDIQLTADRDLKYFNLTWNNISGIASYIYFNVTTTNMTNGTRLVYGYSSNASSGKIGYFISEDTENKSITYIATVYVVDNIEGKTHFIKSVDIVFEYARDIFGKEATFVSFLLIGTLIFIGAYYGIENALVLGVISTIGCFLLGFLAIGLTGIMSLIVMSAILMIKLRKY